MSAVWESSSDIIAISVKSSKKSQEGCAATVMVSPTLEQLERAIFTSSGSSGSGSNSRTLKQPPPRKIKRDLGDARAVVFELEASDLCITPGTTSSFSYVKEEQDTGENKGDNGNDGHVHRLKTNNKRVDPKRVHQIELRGDTSITQTQNTIPTAENPHYVGSPEALIVVGELLVRAWQTSEDEETLVHHIERKDPITGKVKRVRCEAKVTRLDQHSILVVARDETDRHRSSQAEKLVLVERTVCGTHQKDPLILHML